MPHQAGFPRMLEKMTVRSVPYRNRVTGDKSGTFMQEEGAPMATEESDLSTVRVIVRNSGDVLTSLAERRKKGEGPDERTGLV